MSVFNKFNSKNYLHSNATLKKWNTLSNFLTVIVRWPDACIFSVYISSLGETSPSDVTSYIRSSVTLKAGVTLISWEGTLSNPYNVD